jgi:histone deacetylase 11
MPVSQEMEPKEVSLQTLHDVHTHSYITTLHTSSRKVAQVIELGPLRFLPMFLLQGLLLRKLRVHVGGTILAVGLAVVRGWAINVGGGFHHASFNDGATHMTRMCCCCIHELIRFSVSGPALSARTLELLA